MSATLTNGKPRKQLSDQLDRLDGVIDLLADNLNQAVAEAVREGSRQAVKEAVLEILTNPELRGLIARPAPVVTPGQNPSAPSGPSAWSRLKARAMAVKASVVDAATAAV